MIYIIKHEFARDVKRKANRLIKENPTKFGHLKKREIEYVRILGSSDKRWIARCKRCGPTERFINKEKFSSNLKYIIEVNSELYDNLKKTEKEATVYHELLHIPKNKKGVRRHDRGVFLAELKKYGAKPVLGIEAKRLSLIEKKRKKSKKVKRKPKK